MYPVTSSGLIRPHQRWSVATSMIASPSPPAVNSRCSVNAMAGSPMATACSQLRTIDASADVSYDHSV